MTIKQTIGAEAVATKGFIQAYKWLLLRRLSQLSILGLFLLGPVAGVWLIKGNLASSLILDTVPLTEPMLVVQMFAAGFIPLSTALWGALFVVVFYLLVGGRVYCSWVCPVNIITDTASWLRERFGVLASGGFPRNTRYWMIALVMLLAAFTGTMAYEVVNPVPMLHRGIIFGIGLSWSVIIAIFLFDLFIARKGWCGHICPMGALYGIIGKVSPLRVRADKRELCDDCLECFVVCPEPHVIKPALKGAPKGIGPVITAGECTNCGRCIDICAEEVFNFGMRFNNYSKEP
ncbi:MAG TPA: quinol dehydrogenase ferredoxin subunit NapH [Ectothiorhodospiraceae bacterium]|nr:quinol dehydrogenase ferredoxin subunit NapH [Ectothiorhodospiraceae bacterium]